MKGTTEVSLLCHVPYFAMNLSLSILTSGIICNYPWAVIIVKLSPIGKASCPSAEATMLGKAISISRAERLSDDLNKCKRILLADSKGPNSASIKPG